MTFLLLGKSGDEKLWEARDFLERSGFRGLTLAGRRSDPLPAAVESWRGDFLISYLSPWVIPGPCLRNARRAAINFHPGPPEYPGIGCTNFALYEGATVYGVTCHHMAGIPDTGKVVAVRRFPLFSDDTVLSLTQRCYRELPALFREVMGTAKNGPLPECPQSWTRRPFRRSELEALCRITDEMSPGEIDRRVRAVTFPGMPGAYRLREGRREEVLP